MPSFNPCFSGRSTQTWYSHTQAAGIGRVSILVLVEGLLRHFKYVIDKNSYFVSILVLVEGLLRLPGFFLSIPSFIEFQSLFQWKVYLDKNLLGNPNVLVKVSILVLVEGLLRQILYALIGALSVSFNPCFSGRSTQTSALKVLKFQKEQFQSLFQWKVYLDDAIGGMVPGWKSVSILVLVEGLLRLGIKTKMHPQPASFNPCFSGRSTQTAQLGQHKQGGAMFQSLFQWKVYLDRCTSCSYQTSQKFQSLFQWKVYLDLVMIPG